MKSAEDIAYALVSEPDTIPVQSDPSWLREDIAVVLRPLLAVLERTERQGTCSARCLICNATWPLGEEPDHSDACPVPAAMDVV